MMPPAGWLVSPTRMARFREVLCMSRSFQLFPPKATSGSVTGVHTNMLDRSVVCKTNPLRPNAQPLVEKWMPFRSICVKFRGVHRKPPSLVVRTSPFSPTAMPVKSLRMAMPVRRVLPPEPRLLSR